MAITWKSIPRRQREVRDELRRLAGTPRYVFYLCSATAVSAVLLLMAGYVADGYLIDWASVAIVVLLCAVAAWGVVDVVHGIVEHRAARRRDGGR